jgi:hypothetical protein
MFFSLSSKEIRIKVKLSRVERVWDARAKLQKSETAKERNSRSLLSRVQH